MVEKQRGRGFGDMNPERQREIASMGGKAVPNEKRTFSNNKMLASLAGAKGGKAVPAEKRSFSTDRKLAAEAGAKGGRAVLPAKRAYARDPQLAAESGRKGAAASRAVAPAEPTED